MQFPLGGTEEQCRLFLVVAYTEMSFGQRNTLLVMFHTVDWR